MKHLLESNQLIAAFLVIMSAALGIIAYLMQGDPTSRQAMFQLAMGLQGGALGVLLGNKNADTKPAKTEDKPL